MLRECPAYDTIIRNIFMEELDNLLGGSFEHSIILREQRLVPCWFCSGGVLHDIVRPF